MEKMDLAAYLDNGVRQVTNGILKNVLNNTRAGVFILKYGMDARQAEKKRRAAEAGGEHIPPFLIASITSQCNLHCKGCYARANHSCTDCAQPNAMLMDRDWGRIFQQAEELGVAFILLAGGEPLMRRDVLAQAGRHRKILFPLFTNGTMIDGEYIDFLQNNPNLLPVISIEGLQQATDARRGSGMYAKLQSAMEELKRGGILFGASVTVTKQNVAEVLSAPFLNVLASAGAKAVVYVEYVPVDPTVGDLAPDDATRAEINARLADLRKDNGNPLLISFPGDEKRAGGCLAAGRGFFHINAAGGAEPCPFSPYSDTSLKEVSLRTALRSPLFQTLQGGKRLTEEHIGGCVLFEQRDQVERMLAEIQAEKTDDPMMYKRGGCKA